MKSYIAYVTGTNGQLGYITNQLKKENWHIFGMDISKDSSNPM